MMENRTKEVYFNKYCRICKNWNVKETDDPCNECLTQGWNVDSRKPINYEEAS